MSKQIHFSPQVLQIHEKPKQSPNFNCLKVNLQEKFRRQSLNPPQIPRSPFTPDNKYKNPPTFLLKKQNFAIKTQDKLKSQSIQQILSVKQIKSLKEKLKQTLSPPKITKENSNNSNNNNNQKNQSFRMQKSQSQITLIPQKDAFIFPFTNTQNKKAAYKAMQKNQLQRHSLHIPQNNNNNNHTLKQQQILQKYTGNTQKQINKQDFTNHKFNQNNNNVQSQNNNIINQQHQNQNQNDCFEGFVPYNIISDGQDFLNGISPILRKQTELEDDPKTLRLIDSCINNNDNNNNENINYYNNSCSRSQKFKLKLNLANIQRAQDDKLLNRDIDVENKVFLQNQLQNN